MRRAGLSRHRLILNQIRQKYECSANLDEVVHEQTVEESLVSILHRLQDLEIIIIIALIATPNII